MRLAFIDLMMCCSGWCVCLLVWAISVVVNDRNNLGMMIIPDVQYCIILSPHPTKEGAVSDDDVHLFVS